MTTPHLIDTKHVFVSQDNLLALGLWLLSVVAFSGGHWLVLLLWERGSAPESKSDLLPYYIAATAGETVVLLKDEFTHSRSLLSLSFPLQFWVCFA